MDNVRQRGIGDFLRTYFFMASSDPLAKSAMAAVGRATSPTMPLPIPAKKPPTPCCWAPSIGRITTPKTPKLAIDPDIVMHLIIGMIDGFSFGDGNQHSITCINQLLMKLN
jgi:hypothetical protein